MRTSLKNISLIAIGLVTGVLATLQLSATAQNATVGPLPLEKLRLMADIFGQIKREYVEPVDDDKLLTEAIKGMVASLDPHSAYLDKKDFQELQEGTQGRFAGLGIEISQEEGLVKVINPIEDTPAFRAGVQPGDLITRIDDKPVRGMPLEQAVKRMRGAPGTKVTLTIYRKKEERTFPLTITRAEIQVQSVKAKMLDNGIAWVRITSFQERTVPDLAKKLNDLAKQDPHLKGLILDLRNNGGGVLQAAVGVSAAFLPPDATVVSTNGQVPDAKRTYKATFANYRLSNLDSDPLVGLDPEFKTVPQNNAIKRYQSSAQQLPHSAPHHHSRAPQIIQPQVLIRVVPTRFHQRARPRAIQDRRHAMRRVMPRIGIQRHAVHRHIATKHRQRIPSQRANQRVHARQFGKRLCQENAFD